jgi:P-type Ca2+ transporter type 2C
VIAAAQTGLEKTMLERQLPRRAELPFESERQRMTTIHQRLAEADGLENLGTDYPYIAFSKGAIASILAASSQVWHNQQSEPLSDDWCQKITAINDQWATRGIRVLGVGCRALPSLPEAIDSQTLERDLLFLGLIGMIDPARTEVKAAIQTCQVAGIRPIMITGDHPLMAQTIAEELGMINHSQVLTGTDLNQLTGQELCRQLASVSVFARVSPQQKLSIVQALQHQGEIVAMTGDGVNDAPALKQADIGVAMGKAGTDVAKASADMVLLDDNFTTIVAAVKEGRIIYGNIRKFIQYLLSSNSAEIGVMLLAPFLGMPLPLLPLQILWINLLTDGLPALALGLEPAEPNTMTVPPRSPQENIFGRGMGWTILWVGLLISVVTLAIAYLYWQTGDPGWQTMLFSLLTFAQMCNALAMRSEQESVFAIGLASNPLLLLAILLTLGLQLAVIYLPPMQEIFQTTPLSLADLYVCLLISTIVLWAVEAQKWWQRQGKVV